MTVGCHCATCAPAWNLYWTAFAHCYWAGWAAKGSRRVIAVEHLESAFSLLRRRSYLLDRVPCARS